MLVIQLLLWIAIGIVIYTFFGYALLLGLLARFFSRPVKQAEITPSVALFIPAYNEETVIAAKIQNSLALDYPPDALGIALVTDGSNDRTLEIAGQYRSERVKIFHQPERRGKIAAVNRVMPKITQEIVIFSDANAMLDAGAIKSIVRNFADPEVGGVAGEKRVLSGGEGLYWRYESFLKRCDSAFSSVMGAAGELFAIRREVFIAPETDSIIEDFVMSGQTLFYAAALLGYALALKGRRRGIFYATFYFCFSNAAALPGFWRYITNSQPVTWVKVR